MLENVHPWPLQPSLTESLLLSIWYLLFSGVNEQSYAPAKYLLGVGADGESRMSWDGGQVSAGCWAVMVKR